MNPHGFALPACLARQGGRSRWPSNARQMKQSGRGEEGNIPAIPIAYAQ